MEENWDNCNYQSPLTFIRTRPSQESKQDMNNAMTRFYVTNDEEEKDTKVKSASLKALDCKKSRPQF